MARPKVPATSSRGPQGIGKRHRRKPEAELHRNMSAIRATENCAEVELRSILHRMGLRFRKYRRDLLGKPDIVFARARVAVFVDGDFWHARMARERGFEALEGYFRTGTEAYWLAKFRKRIARDDAVTATLRRSGWKVLRYWETAVKADPHSIALQIARTVRNRLRTN